MNSRSARITASGGRIDHNMTARLAQAEITSSQPVTGRDQIAVVTIT